MTETPGFTGFGPSATAFYAELERSNSKDFWAANKHRYDDEVRRPMELLLAALEPEFGQGSVFRPHRDVRFSKDKSPYKTHQGAYVGGGGAGYYVQVSAEGLLVGAGFYSATPDQLARFRAAVDATASGTALAGILDALRDNGYDVDGDQLRTRPRGVAADHPRLDLMRFRSLRVGRDLGEPEWLTTDRVEPEVRAAWRDLTPLVAWVGEHVGAPSS